MSQRDSGYERKERDLYETPEWVTEALIDNDPDEPVADNGATVQAQRIADAILAVTQGSGT